MADGAVKKALGGFAHEIAPRVTGLGAAALQLIPSKFEREERKAIKQERAAIAGGKGGLDSGVKQSMLAQGTGAINAQAQATEAQIARGDASGMNYQQQAQRSDLQRNSLGALGQLQGDIRAADLAEAERKRAELQQRASIVADMKRQRRANALGLAMTAGESDAEAKALAGKEGQNTRYETARPIIELLASLKRGTDGT